ncbi:MAG TPA: acetolactate synthase small subunit [Oscillospiraceae bacterium]|nr:acetolactate synthase small subunit [Oscillospiraceae bacterium]HNW03821.1 acetolactate synthase small subunit [Oscillospiraceae bacterium]HPW00347.1 acetolactate synthase small subunit [Oscillospiraceae bacterium]
MRRCISVLVENHAGVLSHISGLFGRRGFNIESLAVGVTEDKAVSRMTIIVDGDDHIVEQIEKQLNKQIDVIKVRSYESDEIIHKELALIKVAAAPGKRAEILNVLSVIGARVVDLAKNAVTAEICDTSEKIDQAEELLRPYSIKEVARTGTVALPKISEP